MRINAELLNLVTTAGLTPSKTTLTQVTTAVQTLSKHTPSLQYLYFATATSLTGGTTMILGPSGLSGNDNGAMWVMPFGGTIIGVYVAVNTAPVGVQTVTATVFNNSVATAASAVITGAATSATYTGSVAVSATNGLSVHVVMSATAVTAYSHGYVIVQST